MTDTTNIRIGDRITFRAVARWNTRTVTRIVRGYWSDRTMPAFGRLPTVRFGGFDAFIVRTHEITHIERAKRDD
jgi:hypothetical protein